MINKQPAIFNIEQLEVGYSKIRVIHNTPSDIDIASRSVWVKAAGANQSTANRVDTAYISKDHLYVDTLTAGTSYDFSFSLVDAFVSTSSVLLNAQYTGVESVLSITEQNAVSMKTPCTITSVINVNNDQEQIGSPASTVQITFAGTAATSLVEASTDNFSTSEVIYTGAISDNIIAITLSANTYKFRVTSYFTFSDGVVDTGSTDTFSTAVSVSDNITDPAAATGLTASAVKILDNIASHNLKLDWSWALGSTSQKQNTLVQYIEYDGTSAVNWTNAVSEISLGTDHTFNSVPYRKHLKVRVQVQGWNNNPSTSLYAEVFISEDTADSTKTGYILAVDGESLSANTKVYIDSRYIQGFDTSADKTFEFDAATGNVTIGKAGTYNGTSVAVPFQFDAVNSILNISGQVITDEIVAADFVMGWLGGSPPSFRTSNRNATTGYSGTTEGLWMGYTDASTFKFALGDSTQYIKWNGSQLSISGSVTIGDPTGPTLGQQQKSVMYYKAGTTAPNTPTGGTFASPTPTNETGWTTSIPTLATGPDNAYLSQRTFTSDAAAPQDSSWTAPGLFTAGGARGAGNYSKTNASWTSDSNFTTTNVNSALPDGVPVIGDIVILSNTDSATWNRTARYVGGTVSPSPLAAGGWERFTLVINGNALVTGTVVADNFEAISYAADNTTVESTVKLNKGNDLIFAAASVWNPDDGSDPTVKSLETIFQITKDGDGIIDGKAVSVRSIFPSSFSEQAVDYIQNAIGATVNSGGLKSYNGPSGTLTNNSILQKNLNPLTHVNGNPTTISGGGLVSFSNDYSYSTPVAANITMTLNRRLSSQTQSQTVQIATTGSVAVTTSSVQQQGAQGEPSEWTHSYYWNETLTPTAEDLTSGDYVYDIRISCSNTSVIDSVGLTFSVEEQVVTAGVDLSDYATEAEVDTKLLDYVLDTDSRLTNARTATLTGNLLKAVPTNAVFTDTTYSVGDGGLTEKDFTATLKTKLDSIPANANNYVLPNSFTVTGSIGATTIAASTFTEGGTSLVNKYQAIGSYLTAETNVFIGDGGTASTHPGTGRGIYTGQLSSGTAVLGLPTTNNANSILTFNRHTGEYNSQIAFSSNGHMYYRSFNNVAINNTNTWLKVWNAGNDGSGSGLDADKLDGVQGSSFLRSDAADTFTGTITGSKMYLGGSVLSAGSAAALQVKGFQRTGNILLHEGGNTPAANNKAISNTSGNLEWDGDKIWTAGNDGASSGLDADTLDGFQGSDFSSFGYAYSSNNLTRAVGSGVQWYKVASFSGGVKHITMKVVTNGDNTTGADAFLVSCGSYGQNANIVRLPSTSYNSTKLLEVRTETSNTAGYEIWVKVNSITTSNGNLQVYMNDSGVTSSLSAGTEPSLNTSVDVTLPVTSSDRDNYAIQTTNKIEAMGGFVVDGNTVWHAGNDGASSGLDADLLDGVQGNLYARKASPGFTGEVYTSTSQNDWAFRATTGATANSSGLWFTGTTARLILRDGSGNFKTGIAANGDNSQNIINGNTIWHAGNDGASSGLDADLLDGQHGSYYANTATPSAPSITATSVVGETIEVTFTQSSTSGVDHYEVWSDGATGSDYSMIARIPEEDIASTMSIVDASFNSGGTVAYRAYAIHNGVYSAAGTATRAFTVPTNLDVASLSVIGDINVYHINYNNPTSRFLDHIEIYKDIEVSQASLSRTGAALIYSGTNTAFTYNIGASDLDKYHQFWVEVVTV